jgi:cold shock CspA family protein
MSVENNFNEPFIKEFLATKGFIFIEHLAVDDIFVHTDFLLSH